MAGKAEGLSKQQPATAARAVVVWEGKGAGSEAGQGEMAAAAMATAARPVV